MDPLAGVSKFFFILKQHYLVITWDFRKDVIILILFVYVIYSDTAQKIKVSIKDFFSKCDQTADLVTFTEESLMENFTFCAA